MFLLTITKDGIAQNFQNGKIEEFNLHSYKVTVITDKFLSDFISEPNGFSVVESPLINTPDFQNIIFSKVSYDSKNDVINILGGDLFPVHNPKNREKDEGNQCSDCQRNGFSNPPYCH